MIEMDKKEEQQILDLIANRDEQQLKDLVTQMYPADIAELLEELPAEDTLFLYRQLPGSLAADALMEMDEDATIHNCDSELLGEKFADPFRLE